MSNIITEWIEKQLGKLCESECPECGNIDRLTERETKVNVHCQLCYFHYEYKEDD